MLDLSLSQIFLFHLFTCHHSQGRLSFLSAGTHHAECAFTHSATFKFPAVQYLFTLRHFPLVSIN